MDPPLPAEPMEVDDELMTMLRELAIQGHITADMIRESTRREPGEAITTGDMANLGQEFAIPPKNPNRRPMKTCPPGTADWWR